MRQMNESIGQKRNLIGTPKKDSKELARAYGTPAAPGQNSFQKIGPSGYYITPSLSKKSSQAPSGKRSKKP